MTTSLDMQARQSDHGLQDHGLRSTLPALAAVWTGAVGIGVLAPDMVTGSAHEHLPIGLITIWVWAAVASAFVLLTPNRRSLRGWTVATGTVWLATLLVSVLAPVMVTGTDPTRIPLAAIIAPPLAAVVTGLLSLREAVSQLGR